MNLDVSTFGQVFTPCYIVSDMINLMKNQGTILEPSAGDGAFTKKLDNTRLTAIEIDEQLAEKNNFINMDFFLFPVHNKFDTIIGNPPYVRYQDINKSTKALLNNNEIDYSLFDNRSNLYLFFIYKSILHLNDHGELIFITPRDFLKSTSAIKLNEFIFNNGTITEFIETGDKKIFKDASPNTAIWRFEKNNHTKITSCVRNFTLNKGQIYFTKNRYTINFSDIFFVKVGAVSGLDSCFVHSDGTSFVCSYTAKTGKLKKMIYNEQHPSLVQFKNILINRKIRRFNENNWWEWGRGYYQSDSQRIYVNTKTRNKNPFFLSDCKAYDGSVLAIFLIRQISHQELVTICNLLNSVDWEELGFIVDGRFIFSQKSLENTLLPSYFRKWII